MNMSDKVKLIKPSLDYDQEIMAFREEFLEHGGSMDGCGELISCETTKEWLEEIDNLAQAETCPDGYVPMTQFICVREADNKLVGVIQVRHYFNDFLEKFGGHIGYSVRPSERRKGYATEMLGLILPYCKEIGLNKVLVTCLEDNEASRKVIKKNGGIYESTVYEPSRKTNIERYWISL